VELGEHEAHVWYVRLATANSVDLQQACERVLSETEKTQYHRFLVAGAAHQYLVAHALLRTTLSRYRAVSAEAWSFLRGSHGKPSIEQPRERDLQFNLTHTDGLVACVVAREIAVGVDAESLERDVGGMEIADRFFAPREVLALRREPAAMQQQRFFTYWTLKEAYIKARGLGLALPLQQFSFDLDGGIAIAFAPELIDDPGSWQFVLARPTPQHLLAVALQRGGRADLRVTVQETGPLG
jgi:4'-phosphopantetheinyl transferase